MPSLALSKRTQFMALAVAACSIWAGTALAVPTVNNVSLRGLQVGDKTTVTFDGSDLLPAPKVIAEFPIAAQAVLPGGSAARVQIELTLDASVPPGIYPLRLACGKGISNSILVGLDRLPQLPRADMVNTLPVALHGTISGSEMHRTTFNGKKGERLVADVESRRLGANLKPVLRLYDGAGRQLAWSPQLGTISGDARCELVLPADGVYTVELHDLLYKAAARSFFRLKIGMLNYADLAFPVGVQQGQKASLAFVSSNFPPDAKTEFDATPAIPFALDRGISVPASAPFTGAAPRVFISQHPEVVETTPSQGQTQAVEQFPVGISGRLAATGEEDKYLLAVSPGAKLRFDVQARRIGSPLDGVLTVQGEKGEQPMSNDDRPGVADPGLDYTVPQNVTKLVVSLRDLQKRGGADFVYRISVTDLALPDFGLTLDIDRVNVPAGGSQVVKVQIDRRGYNGPLKIEGLGLPMTVQLTGNVIPAGATQGLVTLSAVSGQPFAGLATLVGTSADGNPPVSRPARLPETPASQKQLWLGGELGVAVTEAAPLSLAWVPGSPDEKLPLGSRLPAKLTVTRAEGAKGQIRVKLLTTQVIPKKTVKVNNQNKQEDDLDRALRLEGTPTFAAGVNETEAQILVPADLPNTPWTLVLVAELLAADGKTVIASAPSPARTFVTKTLLALELSGKPTVEAKSGKGETGKLTGKLVRGAGFMHPATLTLEGLPPGFVAPKLEVPADQNEFTFPISFPFGVRLGALKNVKLVATAIVDPRQPAQVVKSKEIDVAVNVVAGEKP